MIFNENCVEKQGWGLISIERRYWQKLKNWLLYNKGPETAASIADAIDAVKNETPILASLSLGNLENLKDLIADHWKPKKVIIAADNDNDENPPQAISGPSISFYPKFISNLFLFYLSFSCFFPSLPKFILILSRL